MPKKKIDPIKENIDLKLEIERLRRELNEKDRIIKKLQESESEKKHVQKKSTIRRHMDIFEFDKEHPDEIWLTCQKYNCSRRLVYQVRKEFR